MICRIDYRNPYLLFLNKCTGNCFSSLSLSIWNAMFLLNVASDFYKRASGMFLAATGCLHLECVGS